MTNNKEPQSKPAQEKAVTLNIQAELRAIGKHLDYVIARLGPGDTGLGEGGEK